MEGKAKGFDFFNLISSYRFNIIYHHFNGVSSAWALKLQVLHEDKEVGVSTTPSLICAIGFQKDKSSFCPM